MLTQLADTLGDGQDAQRENRGRSFPSAEDLAENHSRARRLELVPDEHLEHEVRALSRSLTQLLWRINSKPLEPHVHEALSAALQVEALGDHKHSLAVQASLRQPVGARRQAGAVRGGEPG